MTIQESRLSLAHSCNSLREKIATEQATAALEALVLGLREIAPWATTATLYAGEASGITWELGETTYEVEPGAIFPASQEFRAQVDQVELVACLELLLEVWDQVGHLAGVSGEGARLEVDLTMEISPEA